MNLVKTSNGGYYVMYAEDSWKWGCHHRCHLMNGMAMIGDDEKASFCKNCEKRGKVNGFGTKHRWHERITLFEAFLRKHGLLKKWKKACWIMGFDAKEISRELIRSSNHHDWEYNYPHSLKVGLTLYEINFWFDMQDKWVRWRAKHLKQYKRYR